MNRIISLILYILDSNRIIQTRIIEEILGKDILKERILYLKEKK